MLMVQLQRLRCLARYPHVVVTYRYSGGLSHGLLVHGFLVAAPTHTSTSTYRSTNFAPTVQF